MRLSKSSRAACAISTDSHMWPSAAAALAQHHPSASATALILSTLQPSAVDLAHETEAVLDHYFHHPNTAPFISHRLIQRFTASNPSPRYVESVANAFITGTHDNVEYSGRYGDLGATIAAILLDREARSTTLDADPHHGVMREPLLKLHHFLRSMEFTSRDGREIEMPNIQNDIGMEAHKSPSVFNFYQADYQPAGPVARSGQYAPEAGLATAPYLIGFLNGMTALPARGLDHAWAVLGARVRIGVCGRSMARVPSRTAGLASV